MIAFIKTLLALIFGCILGFGMWYLVGWFLSNESNPLLWNPAGKFLYLFFGFISSMNIVDELTK